MRTWIALGLVAMVAGCEWQPLAPWSDFNGDEWWDDGEWGDMEHYLRGDHDGFEQTSTLWGEIRGITMADDGRDGVAGMNWAACQVEASNGTAAHSSGEHGKQHCGST